MDDVARAPTIRKIHTYMSFDYDKVKNILVCPACKGDLVHDEDTLVCVNPESRLRYPIVDNIPRLLADEASELPLEDWSAVMQRHQRDELTGRLPGSPASET